MNDINDFTVTAGGPDIKEGVYPGKFLGVELYDPEDKAGNKTSQYGPSKRWNFDAIDEDEVIPVNGLSSFSTSPGSKGYKWACGVAGRQFEVDEKINLREYIGQPVTLVIGPNKKGWMGVQDVKPAKTKRGA